MTGQHAQARERAASAAQYVLLGGFAAVAAGISAQGLTGFARSNMELTGPWPYLLFLALDGAAGVCAVLLVRRAARAESGLAPRLAVWGLVAASSTFNWTHAPRRPAAPEAFGLMPVVAALLFEFCLRELRLRTLADRSGRRLSALGWLHPAERIRVQLCMAADEQVPAETATRHVRVDHAARRLYQLRTALGAHDQSARPGARAARRIRRAERRAHSALTRAGFADPAVAAAVLRQVQVLTMTAALARLDYRTADAAQAAIASLIASPGHGGTQTRCRCLSTDTRPRRAVPTDHDAQLVAAATRIVAAAMQDGDRLSQAALAGQLRREGYTVANDRLRWLAAASGLEPAPRHRAERAAAGRPVMARRVPVGSDDRHKRPEDREQRLAALRIRLQETAQEIRTAGGLERGACGQPHGCPAKAGRTSCSSPPAYQTRPWCRDMRHGARPDGRSAGTKKASRSSPARAGRRETAATTKTTSRAAAGATRTASPTSGTCPRPAGSPFPSRPRSLAPPGEVPPGLWDCLCWLARREGFAVEREPGCPADGTTLWTARRIRVLPGLAGGQAVWALAHQLGHVLLHNTTAAPPGTTTSGCQGVRKAEADSVAFITCARHGVRIEHGFSSPQTWAGTDPRAQPGAAILAAGERITAAAAKISRYLDHHLPGSTTGLAAPVRTNRPLTAVAAAAASSSEPDASDRGRPAGRRSVLHRPARRQLGARLPPQARHHRRGHGGVAHRIRPPRMDRAHRLPPRPRPSRRRDPGRRAGPRLLPRNPHRSLPRPGHAAGPRRARQARRVHRPRPPRHRPRRAEIPEQPRNQHLPERRPAVRPPPGARSPRPRRNARHRGRTLRRDRRHPGRPRPLRRPGSLRHRPDHPAGRSARPRRRPPPDRRPRRVRRRHGRPQSRRPRVPHPPRHQRPPAISHAVRQGPRRNPGNRRRRGPAGDPPRPRRSRCPPWSSTRTSTHGNDGCEIPKDHCWRCAAWPRSSPACCRPKLPRPSGRSPATRS